MSSKVLCEVSLHHTLQSSIIKGFSSDDEGEVLVSIGGVTTAMLEDIKYTTMKVVRAVEV